MRKLWLKVGLPIAVLLAAIGATAYLKASKPLVVAQPSSERVWPVAVVEARPQPRTVEISAYGSVVAGRQLDLRPLVDGPIIEVAEELIDGGIVARDAPLVVIDPFDFEIALAQRRADLDVARAELREIETDLAAERTMLERDREQVALAERDVERRETLRRSAATSEKALDDARMILSERRAKAVAARQKIESLEARAIQQQAEIARLEAALRQSERDLERTTITAPFDAFVAEVAVAPGQQVNRSDLLARLIQADRLDVRFHLSAAEFARLAAEGPYAGRAVRVIWRLGEREQAYQARLERQVGEIDPSTGGVDMFARLEPTGAGTLIRPGAFVEVYIPERTIANAVNLPFSAVHPNGIVFTVEEGALARYQVREIARQSDSVTVAGLNAGALVVTTPFPGMASGVSVVVP